MTKTNRYNCSIGTQYKQLAVLIDPDRYSSLKELAVIGDLLRESKVDYVFVGGSLIRNDLFEQCLVYLQAKCEMPILLFPGNSLQVSDKADGILLLSLLSGRNPEFLIGNHVLAAAPIARAQLSIYPTGYILVDGGCTTSVQYMSNTQPIPSSKGGIAASTALAGQQLGLQQIYLDAGSGAKNPVRETMIRTVRDSIDIPLIVGGGIRTPEAAEKAWKAGADLVVIGTAIEENPQLLDAFCHIKSQVI